MAADIDTLVYKRLMEEVARLLEEMCSNCNHSPCLIGEEVTGENFVLNARVWKYVDGYANGDYVTGKVGDTVILINQNVEAVGDSVIEEATFPYHDIYFNC